MSTQPTQKDTSSWILFTWISFLTANGMMMLGIYHAPVDLWVKGFFLMGLLFAVGSTFTLAKTIRDNAEAERQIHRMADAKTEQLINSYELRSNI